MASEPIPEPLTNQDVDDQREPEFRAPRSQVPDNGEAANALLPSIEPSRELGPGRVNPQLNKAAEAVGTTLGRVVNQARGISAANAGPTWKDSAQAKVQEVKQRTSKAISDAQESASVAYQETKERLSETVGSTKETAAQTVAQARRRAREISYNYPVQVIAASVAAGFLAGVVLRVWRSSRYE
jgi:hypothetical protein